MGLLGRTTKKVAKAGASKAGKAIVKKVNGGCPGSDDGKHNYKGEHIGGSPAVKANPKRGIAAKPAVKGTWVTYCRNPGCGRQH